MQEKWQEYYDKDQLRIIQAIELDLLRVFISVCDKLNLEYVLYGGTLLGQVKFGEFIPWDDDIDVALPRESYEKFVEMAPHILPEVYFLQSPYNCPQSPYPYTKLRKRGTKYVEYVHRNLPIETGVYMDIYPIDKIPDDEKERKKQFRRVRKWIFIYVCRQSRLYDKKENSFRGHLKNIARYIVCHLLKVFPQKYCMAKIDHYMRAYDVTDNNRYSALNSPNYNNIYDCLYPLKKAAFCGIDTFIPADYRHHLLRRYGDYSELPPEEERFGHVPYILELGNTR